jgi:hypothetical protein
MKKNLCSFIFATILTGVFATAALAHEGRVIHGPGSNYVIFVGWMTEPTFEDSDNGVIVFARDCPAGDDANCIENPIFDDGSGSFTGYPELTLTRVKVERIGTSGARVFYASEIAAKGIAGEGDGSFTVPVSPTKDGTYKFTVSGTIGTASFADETFICNAPVTPAVEGFDCVRNMDTWPTSASKYANN